MPSKAYLGGALAVLLSLFLTTTAVAETPGRFQLNFSGATGGIIRAPNTNQDHDTGNAFAEAWVKLDLELWRQGNTVLKAFFLGNYVRDTKPYAYNNTTKAGSDRQKRSKNLVTNSV